MDLIQGIALPSLSRVKPSTRRPVRVGLVQTRWHADVAQHASVLRDGIATCAGAGADIVFLQELTLSRYPADVRPSGVPNQTAESLQTGPTLHLAAQAALEHGIFVHASLFRHDELPDGRGWNTAILVGPDGRLVGHTDKLHIPVTAGYYEDQYFTPGLADREPYPVHHVELSDGGFELGMPTCWDEWFPEVARNYSLRGAEVLVYPTAIGSEPDHPDFDTEPLWEKVIIANGISNGTFMVVPNRWGNEGSISFYGSSFISDPYGRVLAQAPREGNYALVADLDLDQRRDWLDLFPFLATRRPDTYAALVEPVVNPRSANGDGIDGGIAGQRATQR
jgi:N-carbamoylputrescine amidase